MPLLSVDISTRLTADEAQALGQACTAAVASTLSVPIGWVKCLIRPEAAFYTSTGLPQEELRYVQQSHCCRLTTLRTSTPQVCLL